MTPLDGIVNEQIEHLLDLGYTDPEQRRLEELSEQQSRKLEISRVDKMASKGQFVECIDLLEKLIINWPEDILLRLKAARAYHTVRRSRDALRHLQEIMYRGVETPVTTMLMGAVLLDLRFLNEAVDQLQYAKHLDKAQVGLNYYLGEAYARTGRIDDAESAFQQELLTNPKCARSHDGLAALALARRDFASATDHALNAIEQNPHVWSAHYRLGVALVGLGNHTEATCAFETAAAINQTKAAPYRKLKELYASDPKKSNAYATMGRERIQKRIFARTLTLTTLG